jgi:hypothetical protein
MFATAYGANVGIRPPCRRRRCRRRTGQNGRGATTVRRGARGMSAAAGGGNERRRRPRCDAEQQGCQLDGRVQAGEAEQVGGHGHQEGQRDSDDGGAIHAEGSCSALEFGDTDPNPVPRNTHTRVGDGPEVWPSTEAQAWPRPVRSGVLAVAAALCLVGGGYSPPGSRRVRL